MQKILYVLILLVSARSWGLSHSLPAEDLFFQNVIYFETESHINGESVKSYCNATLVSNSLAVTAAHCVAYSWLEKINLVHAVVGKYAYVTRHDGRVVRVGYKESLNVETQGRFLMTAELQRRLLRSKDYKIGHAEDMALIQFNQPLTLPLDFQFARVVDKNLFETLKSTVTPKNIESVTINFDENITNGNPKRIGILDMVAWFFQGYFVSYSTSRFAPNDSGAPIFVNVSGEELLLGVVRGRNPIFNYDILVPVRELGCVIAQEEDFSASNKAIFCR